MILRLSMLALLLGLAAAKAPTPALEPSEMCISVWGAGTSADITFLDANKKDIGNATTLTAYPTGARYVVCLKIPNAAVSLNWTANGSGGEEGSGNVGVDDSFQLTWNSGHSGATGRPQGRKPE